MKQSSGFQAQSDGQGNKVIEAKVVLLGDSGVGKSSIAQRFWKNIFPDQHDVTIGGAYFQQTITLNPGEGGIGGQPTQVKLHIWDTGGSEKFRSMIKLYYKDAAAAIICYDLSEEKTFNSCYYWIDQMIQNAPDSGDNFVMALAGNKCDLDPSQVKVSLQTASELAQKHNMIAAETSAKTGKGVQELFKKIAERIVISKVMA